MPVEFILLLLGGVRCVSLTFDKVVHCRCCFDAQMASLAVFAGLGIAQIVVYSLNTV